MASASNQRHSVVSLIVATSPRAITSRWRSGTDQRASGTPTSIGRSQAIRFTSTTRLGGKAGWTPAARFLVEAGEAVAVEALAPFADDLARRLQAGPNLVVAEPRGREEDDLGADDVAIRRRISTRSGFQLAPFRARETDDEWAGTWQTVALPRLNESSSPAATLSS